MLLLAEPWLHNLDPFAIEFSGFVGSLLNGGIRWYGLSYLVGFVVGFLLVRRILTAGISPLKPQQAADLVVTVAIGLVVGGRLGYVLFYKPELLTEFTPDAFPWWGALKINQGGMASHGGMIGGIAGCLFFAWRHRAPTAHLLDLIAFGAPLGLFMGRVANFINGELYGRECPADSALAVQFPQEIAETWGPDRLRALEQFAIDNNIAYQSVYDLAQMAPLKAQAGDPLWTAFLSEHLTPRYPSQLFAGVTEGLIVFAVLLLVYRKPVKAGVVAGWFAVTYSVMRVINELFRMPDQHLMDDGQIPLITRGQLLSLGLLAFGIGLIIWAKRKEGPKLGGWMKVEKPAAEEAKPAAKDKDQDNS